MAVNQTLPPTDYIGDVAPDVPAQPAARAAAVEDGYDLIDLIGRGGHGVVYSADDRLLRREVAIKFLEADGPERTAAFSRLRAEARAAAGLRHPGIVQIYKVADSPQGPYLVMEFVPGGTLHQRTGGRPQSPADAARFVARLAQAVEYAHRCGVIHRDLKPANVLVAEAGDGLASAQPKVTDFGIAATPGRGGAGGTVGYTAPEEFTDDGPPPGPVSDIYSLGAILYELLTGRTPFPECRPEEYAMIARLADPPSPGRFRPGLCRDLQAVCLKCFDKFPEGRYLSAADLAADLLRYVKNCPVTARACPPGERVMKWLRRRPGSLGLISGFLLTAFIALWAGSWGLSQKDQADQYRKAADHNARSSDAQRRIADRVRHRAALRGAGAILARAQSACESGDVRRGLVLFAEALAAAEACRGRPPPGENGGGRAGRIARAARLGLAMWQFRHAARLRAALPQPDHAYDVDFAADGRSVLTADMSGRAARWDVTDGRLLGATGSGGPANWLARSLPGGRVLIVSGKDGARVGRVKVFDDVGRLVFSAPQRFAQLHRRLFLPLAAPPESGELLALSRPGRLDRFDLATGAARGAAVDGDDPILAVVAVGGRAALIGTESGAVLRYEPGEAVKRVADLGAPVVSLAASPDGHFAAAGVQIGGRSRFRSRVTVLDAETGSPAGPPIETPGEVRDLAFGPKGRSVAAAGVDRRQPGPPAGFLYLLDGRTGESRHRAHHRRPLWSVAFAGGGGRVVAGGQDGACQIYEADTGRRAGRQGHVGQYAGTVNRVARSPDGRTFAMSCLQNSGGAVGLFDVGPSPRLGRPVRAPSSVRRMAFTPDGRRLWCLLEDGRLACLDPADGRVVKSWRAGPPGTRGRLAATGLRALTWTHWSDGKTPARLWDLSTGGAVAVELPAVYDASFSPAGRFLVTVDRGYRAVCRDAATGRPLPGPALTRDPPVTSAAVDDSGAFVVTLHDSWRVVPHELRRRVGGRAVWRSARPPQRPDVVSFRPGGASTLVTYQDGSAQWLDCANGEPLGPTLHPRLGPRPGPRFAQWIDGGELVMTGGGDSVALWEPRLGLRVSPPLEQRGNLRAAAVVPGGRLIAVAGRGGVIRFWRKPEPVTGQPEAIRCWVEAVTALRYNAEPFESFVALTGGEVADRYRRLDEEFHGGPRFPEPVPPWRPTGKGT